MSDSKVAVVVASGKGMGAAIAKELHERDYRLALMSNAGGADALASTLGAVSMTGSVVESGDLSDLVDLAMSEYGRIDAVVNNTGHAAKGPILELTDDEWHDGLELMLLNVVRMARLITPIMEAQGGGSIVNISTFAAFEPDAAFPISSSLRAALAGFTKVFADRYARTGIRMNNVLPGFIDSYPQSDENVARIPTGRYGTVAEVAKTVGFLLSADASYITGQNLRVDGGITRSV